MFYYENKDGSFEDLIRDYVSRATDAGYEIGKGWPGFSLSELDGDEIKGIDGLAYGFSAVDVNIQSEDGESVFESEMNYMRSLVGDLALKLLPAVDEVLDSYDHEGSPIFGGSMDKALLSEIVEKALHHTAVLLKDIRDIMVEPHRDGYSRRALLQSICEGIVLREIFAVRRHHHRRVLG